MRVLPSSRFKANVSDVRSFIWVAGVTSAPSAPATNSKHIIDKCDLLNVMNKLIQEYFLPSDAFFFFFFPFFFFGMITRLVQTTFLRRELFSTPRVRKVYYISVSEKGGIFLSDFGCTCITENSQFSSSI